MIVRNERFEMRVEPELMARIEQWSEKQTDRPSRAEAVRRLVEAGLERSDSKVSPSGTEKLMLWMLAELCKANPGSEGAETSKLIQQAIYGGHYWALDWELTGILHEHVDTGRAVSVVVNTMDMWNFIERAYEGLSKPDKKKVEDAVGPTGKNPQFIGFDGNNETEHMSIARFLVEELGRFERFKGRSFNSHMPKVQRYLTMYQMFEPMRAKLIDRELNADELIQLLKRD